MKRPSLLTMMLVPTLLTITVGLAGFGVYVDRIESESRLADIDEELVRAASAGEARGRPTAPSGEGDPAPDQQASVVVDTVDPPVELILADDGTILRANGADNPFSADELAALDHPGGSGHRRQRRVPRVGQPPSRRRHVGDRTPARRLQRSGRRFPAGPAGRRSRRHRARSTGRLARGASGQSTRGPDDRHGHSRGRRRTRHRGRRSVGFA